MKQIIFTLMMLALPLGAMAQVDDLYYVPKKKQTKQEVKVTTPTTTIKVTPATVSTQSSGTSVVRIGQKNKSNIVNGFDEDAYNRRPTQSNTSTEQEYIVEEEVYENSQEEVYSDEVATDDYAYSSRIVRFHSPRRAVILSSPLYWDVVYNSGLDNWTIYDDGIYWDVYSDYGYTTIYTSPFYSPSWNWYSGCGWSFGWGYSSWHWNWGYHYPHWHHHHHFYGGYHGHHFAAGGWRPTFNGGYREAYYNSRNGRGNYVPRASGPARADAGVRAGTVARNDRNTSSQNRRTVRQTDKVERVYNRPSSTRNNATRTGVTNERTNKVERATNERTNNVTRTNTPTRTNNERINNAVRESNNTKVQRTTPTKREETNRNNNSNRNERSSYNNTRTENRTNVSRSSNSGRSNNSRSTMGNQSRGSGFSGGGGRSSGGSRGGGGGRR